MHQWQLKNCGQFHSAHCVLSRTLYGLDFFTLNRFKFALGDTITIEDYPVRRSFGCLRIIPYSQLMRQTVAQDIGAEIIEIIPSSC